MGQKDRRQLSTLRGTTPPEPLLERIITASSNEDDVVLDPFCGCGTAVAVAHRLKRRWIGIDITHLAINLIRHRLQDAFGPEVRQAYKVIGEPEDLGGAEELASSDPYQFQWWALGLVGARPAEQKKGADKGIDGRLYFHDEKAGGKTKQVILSVKAGHTNVAHLRDLRGVLDREKAEIGVLISLQEPTAPMRKEAASAGFYSSPWGEKYPRLQILTIKELLDGNRIAYPTPVNVTFRRAPRAAGRTGSTMDLPLDAAEETPDFSPEPQPPQRRKSR
jgi:SAM-dependent methyltransferase